jgi:hypothetical protein
VLAGLPPEKLKISEDGISVLTGFFVIPLLGVLPDIILFLFGMRKKPIF